MFTESKFVFAVVVAALVVASPLIAGAQGRILGTVVDEEGEPLQGVKVTVHGLDIDAAVEATTNKKGKFRLLLLDATHKFKVVLEKDGYQTVEEPLTPKPGGNFRGEWRMVASQMEAELEAAQGSNEAIEKFNQAAQLYNAGDIPGAVSNFEAALALAPEMPAANKILAQIYVSQGDFERAVTKAEKLREVEPEDSEATLLLYDSYSGVGRTEEAEALLDQALAEGQNREVAIRLFNQAVEAKREQGDAVAITLFERVLDADPSLTEARASLASIYLAQLEYEQALAHADALLEADAGNLSALTIRYEALRGVGRVDEAKEALAALQNLEPEMATEAFYQQGVTLFNAGKFDEAVAALERVVSMEEGHARAHYMLGLCFTNLENNELAAAHLERFLTLAPEDPDSATAREMLEYVR